MEKYVRKVFGFPAASFLQCFFFLTVEARQGIRLSFRQ